MKQEEQKIRSVFVQRETLETWLRQMAIKGWIVKDFTYIFFDSFLFFRFENSTAIWKVLNVKYLGDEDIFTSLGWKLLLEHESTMIFYHEDIQGSLPLLDMRMYSLRRFLKSISNLVFLIAVIFALRMDNETMRQQVLFYSAFLLFAFPRLYDVKSTQKGSNFTKLIKNIVLAAAAAVLTTLLIEAAIKAFAALV